MTREGFISGEMVDERIVGDIKMNRSRFLGIERWDTESAEDENEAAQEVE